MGASLERGAENLGKEDRDVKTKVVAFNPESLDFLGMLHRVYSYSLIQLTY